MRGGVSPPLERSISVLWYILREKVWEPIKPQYRVLIGMVLFSIIGPNLPLNFKIHTASTMFAFITVPAGGTSSTD
jgi:hypothetical protein